jgi:hypothetical protein
VRASGHDDTLLNNFRIPSGFMMAPDLRMAESRSNAPPAASNLSDRGHDHFTWFEADLLAWFLAVYLILDADPDIET